jgi:hypothetical protein
MERIKFTNGLIAFAGAKGEGKTRFMLKYANFLAKSERVLFLCYQDYSERLQHILKSIDGEIQKNLQIDSSMEFYTVESFIRLIEFINEEGVKTIIIDSIEDYSPMQHPYNANEVVNSLMFMANHTKARVIFTLNLHENFNVEKNSTRPNLSDFIWPRAIVNQCTQIFSLFRPAFHGLTVDEDNNALFDCIELHSLKNEEHKHFVMEFDNKVINLFDT